MTKIEKIKKSLELSDVAQNFLRQLGCFYHDKHINNLNEAYKQIKELGIRTVVVDNRTVYIVLERPGLFIGSKGSNIEAVERYLNDGGFIGYKIQIIEDKRPPMDFLTSWQYAYFDEE